MSNGFIQALLWVSHSLCSNCIYLNLVIKPFKFIIFNLIVFFANDLNDFVVLTAVYEPWNYYLHDKIQHNKSVKTTPKCSNLAVRDKLEQLERESIVKNSNSDKIPHFWVSDFRLKTQKEVQSCCFLKAPSFKTISHLVSCSDLQGKPSLPRST